MILRVDNVCKSFGDQRVLEGVTLEIDKGMVFVLAGPSGGGKTTLARIVSGLIGFDAGQLTLGQDILPAGQAYPQRLYGQIGVVFQEHNLLPHMTALQNVELGLRYGRKLGAKESRERATHELAEVGLADKSKQYPATLSGGECQRVAIARALAMDPLVLLLDEPTTGLDPLRISGVLDSIARLSRSGTTMLLITHNLRFARHTGNRFAVLADGKIAVSDSPAVLDRLDAKWA